mgnify:CR=1 FL=1
MIAIFQTALRSLAIALIGRLMDWAKLDRVEWENA